MVSRLVTETGWSREAEISTLGDLNEAVTATSAASAFDSIKLI